jgi:hypothetical protein
MTSTQTNQATTQVSRLDEGQYVLSVGALQMQVDSNRGGRITRFARAGRSVLLGSDAQPEMYGSTFWTSPQNGAGGWGWPPVVAVDSAPYTAVVEGDALVLTGPVARIAGAEVAISKRFALDPLDETIAVTYTIHNLGSAPATFAPWEITRVPAGGVTFFPTGLVEEPLLGQLRALQRIGDITWFDWAVSAPAAGDGKFSGDGREGWVAHCCGDLLLVKRFTDIAPGEQAPGEGEIEVYAEGDKCYEEVEQQGRYSSIAPASALTWTVRWALLGLTQPVQVGDPLLVSLARGVRA